MGTAAAHSPAAVSPDRFVPAIIPPPCKKTKAGSGAVAARGRRIITDMLAVAADVWIVCSRVSNVFRRSAMAPSRSAS